MTDTAISGFMETRERELIPWLPVEGDSSLESLEATEKDGSGRWDQFATNEKRFGVTTDYDEEFYTTRLDRSRPDFREREREAARLAAEIEKGPAAFAHVAEERGLEVDDSGMDEEEKYSSVIRAPGKYVPPAVRKSEEIKGSAKPATPTETKEPSAETAGKKSSDTLGSESAGSPATPTSQPGTAAARPKPNLPPQLQSVARQPARTGKEIAANIGSVVGDFRDFSQKEKESLLNTRRNIHNTDRNNLLETFRKFSTDFQIKAPIPPDLEPILHKNKKTPPSATSAASPVPSASSPSSAKELTPTSETKDAATTTEAPTARERAATPSAGPAAEKKEFKFNVEAEEFSFNVEATEFVPVGYFFSRLFLLGN